MDTRLSSWRGAIGRFGNSTKNWRFSPRSRQETFRVGYPAARCTQAGESLKTPYSFAPSPLPERRPFDRLLYNGEMTSGRTHTHARTKIYNRIRNPLTANALIVVHKAIRVGRPYNIKDIIKCIHIIWRVYYT